MKTCIAVFETTFETLRAEDFFRAENIPFRPVLKPRKIGSACRMALRFSGKELDTARRAVAKGNLSLLAFYEQEGDGWRKIEPPR